MSTTPQFQRMNPLNLVAAGAIGWALGLSIEFIVASRGRPPFVPPYSVSITLALLAVTLIVLGLRLKKQVAQGRGSVNPFHAVRLLATARAGQVVGAIFAGLGGGMLLSLAGRSVPAPTGIWVPMLVTTLAGGVLLVCAIIVERMCRVPPGDDEEGGTEPGGVARLEG